MDEDVTLDTWKVKNGAAPIVIAAGTTFQVSWPGGLFLTIIFLSEATVGVPLDEVVITRSNLAAYTYVLFEDSCPKLVQLANETESFCNGGVFETRS